MTDMVAAMQKFINAIFIRDQYVSEDDKYGDTS